MALKEKLRQIRDQDQIRRADARALLPAWLDAIRCLYQRIESILSQYKAEGLIRLERRPITCHEEFMGEYETEEMRLSAGETDIILRPAARLVIGADGRLDLYVQGLRDQGFHLFWFRGSTPEGRWEVASMADRNAKSKLTNAKFEEIIEGLIR